VGGANENDIGGRVGVSGMMLTRTVERYFELA
jgi:hypothetical protein